MPSLQPDTRWMLTAPGALVLPTTQYRIEGTPLTGYVVFWGDTEIDRTISLDYAKLGALNHMRDMLAMGQEP